RGNFFYRSLVYVADPDIAALVEIFPSRGIVSEQTLHLFFTGDLVRSDIDDDGAGFHEVARNHGGLADGRNNDIRLPRDFSEISGSRMADGHCSVGVHQKNRLRLAYIVTASENNSIRAFQPHLRALEQLHDSEGCTGNQRFMTKHQRPQIA